MYIKTYNNIVKTYASALKDNDYKAIMCLFSEDAKVFSFQVGEQSPSTAPSKPKTSPSTKPGKPGTKPQKPPSPFKNPNPNENPAPKAKKISPENAKDEVIDVIIKLLEK